MSLGRTCVGYHAKQNYGMEIMLQSPPQRRESPFPLIKRLSRRQRQVLELILLGDSEKQIARRLQISQHTVHVYLKALYITYEANSRGELMARFIAPAIFDAISQAG
jgi:DNA-binding NarL/FixJ family response regulator